MKRQYARVLALLVLTLTFATAGGQTPVGVWSVVIRSGSATLHAMLWRPLGRGPFPALLLNHGSGWTGEEVVAGGRILKERLTAAGLVGMADL